MSHLEVDCHWGMFCEAEKGSKAEPPLLASFANVEIVATASGGGKTCQLSSIPVPSGQFDGHSDPGTATWMAG